MHAVTLHNAICFGPFGLLQSLADGNNVVPTIVPTIVAPLGILLLLVSVSMTVKLRIIQRQLSHHLIPGMSSTSVDLPEAITAVDRRFRQATICPGSTSKITTTRGDGSCQ